MSVELMDRGQMEESEEQLRVELSNLRKRQLIAGTPGNPELSIDEVKRLNYLSDKIEKGDEKISPDVPFWSKESDDLEYKNASKIIDQDEESETKKAA